jgi:hypothetical protein
MRQVCNGVVDVATASNRFRGHDCCGVLLLLRLLLLRWNPLLLLWKTRLLLLLRLLLWTVRPRLAAGGGRTRLKAKTRPLRFVVVRDFFRGLWWLVEEVIV